MNKETIKDFYGRIIGSIETDNRGNAVAKDFYGRLLGSYDTTYNVTKDFYRRIIGSGNQLMGLIYEANGKNGK